MWLGRDAQFRAEGRACVEAALARRAPSAAQAAVARLYFGLALLRTHGELPVRLTTLDRALRLWDGDPSSGWLRCYAQIEHGRTLCSLGDIDAAQASPRQARALLDASATARVRGLLLLAEASLWHRRGQLQSAALANQEAARMLTACGADSLTLCALNNLADIAWSRGDLATAATGFARATEAARRSSFASARSIGHPLGNLAGVLLELGRLDEASSAVAQALPLLCEANSAWDFCDVLALGCALVHRYADAAYVIGFVDRRYTAIGE